jgi:hypothetical protein
LEPVYVAAQLGHTEGSFSMRVYARAVKRRSRLTGEHLREFDKALEWAQMGTNLDFTDRVPGLGLLEPIAG